ncbi:hypothetical protein B0T21DRAFT_358166 [Apiosordaria backusii]|uniref:Uncharacterized protein n=1 Tax=Apiosordaria backusii TaxID=314023 RepID=A0AA40ESG7_9PEZI|nr:hypothetical protein B0T21DRAFT_358166 [Apiosordaria backusii]
MEKESLLPQEEAVLSLPQENHCRRVDCWRWRMLLTVLLLLNSTFNMYYSWNSLLCYYNRHSDHVLESPLPSSNPTAAAKEPEPDPNNPWDSITPSPELKWHPCYQFVDERFLCAKLAVAMDHSSPLAPDNEVHLALVLLPASPTNTTTDTQPRRPWRFRCDDAEDLWPGAGVTGV